MAQRANAALSLQPHFNILGNINRILKLITLSNHYYVASFAFLEALLEVLAQLFHISLFFRNYYLFCTAGKSHLESNKPGCPPHDFHKEKTFKGAGSIPYPVDGVERRVDSRIKSYRIVGPPDII